MRLEMGAGPEAARRASELLDEMESAVLGLSASGENADALARLADLAATLKLVCTPVLEFSPILEGLAQFENLARVLGRDPQRFDKAIGGVFLHAVSVVKHALSELGSESQANRGLFAIIQELTRAMGELERVASRPLTASPDFPVQAKESPASSVVEEYREAFLSDHARIFDDIERLASECGGANQRETRSLEDLFRLVHTAKGNAMALGFDDIASFSHAYEDLLQGVRAGNSLVTAEQARAIAQAAAFMKGLHLIAQSGGARPKDFDSRVIGVRQASKSGIKDWTQGVMGGSGRQSTNRPAPQANVEHLFSRANSADSPVYLVVEVNGVEFLVSGHSVIDVLRDPRLMRAPSGNVKWQGLIRHHGAVSPFIGLSSLLEDKRAESSGSSMGRLSSWVIIVNVDGKKLCVGVDEVKEVIELPAEQPDHQGNRTKLDLASLVARLIRSGDRQKDEAMPKTG